MLDPNEKACCVKKINLTHFAQAKDTPFSKVTYPYKEIEQMELDTLTYSPQSKRILQILTGKSTDPIESLIDTESWRNKFKKWSEKTTTSLSGLHLGLLKGLLQPTTNKQIQIVMWTKNEKRSRMNY
jgi:hypothetical protein